MSEYSDVLYDPKDHTHVSCVRDIANTDIVILMIGSRFGGKAIDQALPLIDFDTVSNASTSVDILAEKERLSITQLEILKSVELEIPLFAFVDEKVYADHRVYQSNKSTGIVDKIKFPSIEKPETAKYIFEFINLITHRVSNNAITPYRNFSQIEDHLVKQWSLLFQNRLREQRGKSIDQRRTDAVIDQIESLKAAVLQSISAPAAREIAKSVIRFRRLADLLIGLKTGPNFVDIDEFSGSFDDLINSYGIVSIDHSNDSSLNRCYLILDNGTFYSSRMPSRIIFNLGPDWEGFKKLNLETRHAVVEAVEGAPSPMPVIRYIPELLENYRARTEVYANDARINTPTNALFLAEQQLNSPSPPATAAKPARKVKAKIAPKRIHE